MQHEGHPDVLTMQLMAVVGNQLFISVDAPHPVVVIINHLWNFHHPCKILTQNLVKVGFVDCIHSRLLPDTGNSFVRCVHCRDHGDNIVVNPSLDLEVVLVVDPIQGVEALIEDIFVIFQCPTSPGSCSTTDVTFIALAPERTLYKVKRLSIAATYCLDSFWGSFPSNNKTESMIFLPSTLPVRAAGM